MRCGKTPADCLACTRAVCVWDETDKLPSACNWWPKDAYQAFGAALRQARKQRNYTQREMAQHLGVSYSAYSFWERGVRQPLPYNWNRLVQHVPELAPFAPDKPPQLHTQPDDGQEAPGRNGSNG